MKNLLPATLRIFSLCLFCLCFLVSIHGCKSGKSPISPILPDGTYSDSSSYANDNYYNQDMMSSNTSNGEVRIKPAEIRSIFINAYGRALVFMNKKLNPEYFRNPDNWKLNNGSTALDSSKQIYDMSGMILNIPLTQTAFSELLTTGSLHIHYNDEINIASHEIRINPHSDTFKPLVEVLLPVIRPVISQDSKSDALETDMVRHLQTDPCDGFCSLEEAQTVEFCFCGDGGDCEVNDPCECRHEPLENEPYSIVYCLNNQQGCQVDLKLTEVTAYAVKHENAHNILTYDKLVDGDSKHLTPWGGTDPIYDPEHGSPWEQTISEGPGQH